MTNPDGGLTHGSKRQHVSEAGSAGKDPGVPQLPETGMHQLHRLGTRQQARRTLETGKAEAEGGEQSRLTGDANSEEVIRIERMILKIRERRNELGMTQTQLGEKMNVSQAVVANWETGLFLPKTRDLPALARALNFRSIDELYPEEVRP